MTFWEGRADERGGTVLAHLARAFSRRVIGGNRWGGKDGLLEKRLTVRQRVGVAVPIRIAAVVPSRAARR